MVLDVLVQQLGKKIMGFVELVLRMVHLLQVNEKKTNLFVENIWFF
jgi:hypothetical protein